MSGRFQDAIPGLFCALSGAAVMGWSAVSLSIVTTNFVYDFGILMPRQSGNKHEDSQKGSKTQGKP